MTEPKSERVNLASWPTPMEQAPRLASAIGLDAADLSIKRDDLTGLAAGGNKIRKLEWTVGAALADGADTLITTGAPQSNHARLTAAAAARLGLRSILVFPGASPGDARGNLLLDALLGAEIVWARTADEGQDTQTLLDSTAHTVAEECTKAGGRPSIIPFGGSNALGAHGYRLAALEILEQVPDVDLVVCALGSGGTMAGLVAGLGPGRVLGVDTGALPNAKQRVTEILEDMDISVKPAELRIHADQVGDGYQFITDSARHALTVAAATEGLILDPTYTARALAGLIADIAAGYIRPGTSTVFLASGGLPGLFGHPDASDLTGHK